MDTLAITDKLIASGAPEPQARAHAQIQEESSRETKAAVKEEVAKATEGLATRADLLEAIAGLREDNAKLRQEMTQMETRMTRFSVGAMIGGMTVLTAIFSIIVVAALQSLN